jgi:AcrR family transcriptional regulator
VTVNNKRRGRPGYDLASLLAVAVEVFNERGYDSTSMEDLSRRLGIAKSAIYHHVAGKEELLRLALDRALDGWSEVAERAQRLDAPAIDRLEYLVRGSVMVLQTQLPYVTLLLRVRGNTKAERDALSRRRDFDRLVADLVQEAERDGDIRPDVDPAITARLLFGMVNSLVEWYRPGRHSPDAPSPDGAAPDGVAPDLVAPDGAAPADGSLADAVCAVAFDGLRLPRRASQRARRRLD